MLCLSPSLIISRAERALHLLLERGTWHEKTEPYDLAHPLNLSWIKLFVYGIRIRTTFRRARPACKRVTEMNAAGGWVCQGDKAPCFELPDSNFTSVSPIGANTKVVLSFFPAAFSGSLDGGCECQMRTLNQELSALAGHKDVAVYGIGRELPFTMSAWSEKMGLDFPLLSDATLSVAQAFVGVCDLGGMLANRSGIAAMKGYRSPNRGVVVIDDGTVVYKWVGKSAETGRPDPSILPDLAPVKRVLARERPRL